MKAKILAVVVTFNRLELLKRCFAALRAQTYEDFDILIVNNGSNDGTEEWLDSLSDDTIVLHQDNLGGAGGFYAGQKYGFDNGYDWIWMMDDDGVPAASQLEELLRIAKLTYVKIAAPIVLNIDNDNEEAFYPGQPLNLPEGNISDNTRFVCPFNGIMFQREVIETIGFIKKELFIWGDEREYTLRWRKAGFKEYAALKAVHHHPSIKTQYDRVLPYCNKYKVAIKPERFTKYYYRNNGYINRHYSTSKVAFTEGLLYTIYFTRKLKFKELFKFLKYYSKGYLLDL